MIKNEAVLTLQLVMASITTITTYVSIHYLILCVQKQKNEGCSGFLD